MRREGGRREGEREDGGREGGREDGREGGEEGEIIFVYSRHRYPVCTYQMNSVTRKEGGNHGNHL